MSFYDVMYWFVGPGIFVACVVVTALLVTRPPKS